MKNVLLERDLNPAGFEKILCLEPDSHYEFRMAAYAPGYGLDIQAIITEAAGGGVVSRQDIGWFSFLSRTEFRFEFHTGPTSDYRLELCIAEGREAKLEIEYIALNSLEPLTGQGAYTHSIMRRFDPETVPLAGWLAERIVFAGAVNQTTARMLAFQSGAAHEAVTLDIIPPDGVSFACFEVRMIRDQVLPPACSIAFAAEGRAGWWITFEPDGSLTPGVHTGVLRIMDRENVLEELTLILDIADFHLPEPDIAYLQYHTERYIPGEFLTDALRRAYYEDMRRHGMNTVTVYNNPDVNGIEFDLDHNWQFSTEELELRRYRNSANSPDPENRKFNYGLAQEMTLIAEAGLGGRFPVLWLAGKMVYSDDRNDWWGGMNAFLLKEIYQNWNPDWPRPLYYVIDEPSGIKERTDKALELLNALEKSGCDIPLVSANIDEEPLGRYYQVWVQGVPRINEAMVRAAGNKKAELWAYCCSTSNRTTAQPRAMFGFWAARTGVRGVAQWAYHDACGEFCGDTDRSRCCLSRVGLSPDGPVPTLSWEATREGVTDYRIVQLCRSLIERLRKSPSNAETEKLLSESDKTMQSVLDSVSFNLFAPLAGSGSFADRNAFNPVLGLGEPETIFERKRAALWKLIGKIDLYLKVVSKVI